MDNKLKFLMINPTAEPWRVENRSNPTRKTQIFRFSMLSSLYVAAAMPDFVEIQIVDEDIETIDFETDADLVGISLMTFNAPRAYQIADKFRLERNKPVILGGYHPTFMPQEAIEHADAVCLGEAETNVPMMIEDFLAGNLKSFYKNGLVDLRNLAVPDRNLIRKSAYAQVDTVQATRGCPHQCKFCSITSFFKHGFRSRPVDEVINELSGLGRYLLFMDDNITVDTGYAKELFAKMIPLSKRWFSQCNIRIAYDDELLDLAYQSGCRGLFIGFESVDQNSLKSWNKSTNSADDYEWAVNKIHAKGISICAGIVFGNDCDTPEVFDKTLDFLERTNIDSLQATILTPFPGTVLFDELNSQGRIFDKDWAKYDFGHVVFEPQNMRRKTLGNGHKQVLEKFYSKNKMAKRFFKQLRYLDPSTMLRATIPLNLSYRVRLQADGTF